MSWGQDPRDSDRDHNGHGQPHGDGDEVPPFDPPSQAASDGGGYGPPDPQWGRDPERRTVQWGGDPQWGRDTAAGALRPMDLGDVLDGMFRIARTHWRAFLIALGVVVVPLSLLSGLVLAQTLGSMPGLLETLQDPGLAPDAQPLPDATAVARAAATGALSSLAALLLTPLLYGIAVHVAATGYRAGHVDPMGSVRFAGRRYFVLLGAGVLVVAILLVLFVGVALVIGVLAAAAGDSGALAAASVALVGLAAVVVAVIVTVRLALIVPAIIIEGAGPASALQRSNELVRGGTGRTFVTLLVVWIVVAIISFVLALPFQAGAFTGGQAGAAVATLGSIVSSLVTDSLIGAALVLIYFDRRVRAEGYDLTELADELEQRSDPEW